MSLSIFFRVVGMRADESMEHSITVLEQRRPLLRDANAQQGAHPGAFGQGLGGPINPGRGPMAAGDMQQGPPALLTIPVTAEQFASFRINQILELGMGAIEAQEKIAVFRG